MEPQGNIDDIKKPNYTVYGEMILRTNLKSNKFSDILDLN